MKYTDKNIKTLFQLDPSSIICLYKIKLKENRGEYLFHAGENGYKKEIIFDGKSYDYFPIIVEGFEIQGDGRLPRPRMTLSNHRGAISLRLPTFNDFINYKVTRIKTFVKFLDSANFPDGVNPHADPDPDAAFAEDVYFVNEKIKEDDNVVEFELVSLLELQNSNVPARTVYSNTCPWQYRSDVGCGYIGKPISDSKNKKFVPSGYNGDMVGSEVYFSGDIANGEFAKYEEGNIYKDWENTGVYFTGDVVRIVPLEHDSSLYPVDFYVCMGDTVRSNPIYDKENWVLDDCDKSLCGCRLRFSDESIEAGGGKRITSSAKTEDSAWTETKDGLPFGGFPGVDPYDFN